MVVALGGNTILRQGEQGLAREWDANIERTCRDLPPLLTRILAKELGPHGITVNVVAAAYVDTALEALPE